MQESYHGKAYNASRSHPPFFAERDAQNTEKQRSIGMELAAIRHFADNNYCYAVEEGRFLIRLETKRGMCQKSASTYRKNTSLSPTWIHGRYTT